MTGSQKVTGSSPVSSTILTGRTADRLPVFLFHFDDVRNRESTGFCPLRRELIFPGPVRFSLLLLFRLIILIFTNNFLNLLRYFFHHQEGTNRPGHGSCDR